MLVKATLAVLLSAASLPVLAAQCETTVESNDAMQFNTKEIVVDASCKQFTVHLKHVGKMAKAAMRSEEHTSELQSLMRISYAVFCLKKKTIKTITDTHTR